MTRYTKTFAEAMKEVRKPKVVKEDYEVSMAIGQLRTINEYATKLISILESKGSEYDIEAWVQSKITTAEDYMNSVGHYMENNPEVNEAKEDGKIGPAGKIALAKEKDTDSLEKTIVQMQGKMNLLQQKLENEKNKAVKPVPNKDTGEVPLSVGIAYKHLRDKMKTETADVPNRGSKEKESLSLDTPVQKDKVLPKDKGKTMTKQPQTDVELNPKLNLSF